MRNAGTILASSATKRVHGDPRRRGAILRHGNGFRNPCRLLPPACRAPRWACSDQFIQLRQRGTNGTSNNHIGVGVQRRFIAVNDHQASTILLRNDW